MSGAGVIALQDYPYSVFRQVVEMNIVLPEMVHVPLFDKNIPLLQCMISCVVLSSCLLVLPQDREERAKDTSSHIAIKQG